MRPARRGQATVELALGILILIPVLMLGIHFAEVGALTLRVIQAANSAIWDTTAVRMHEFNGELTAASTFYKSPAMVDALGRNPNARANALYADFDGLSSSSGTGPITQALTRGSALAVSCTPATIAPIPPEPAGAPGFPPSFNNLKRAYHLAPGNRDGMACQAAGKMQSWMIPQSFFQKGSQGYFTEQLVRLSTFRVCAFGRAAGGACAGSVPVALDDWALSGSAAAFGSELSNCNANCAIYDTGNQAYKGQVFRIYDGYNNIANQVVADFIRTLFTGDGRLVTFAGVTQATAIVPALSNVPVDERRFRMAFVGEEGDNGSDPFRLITREQNTTAAYDYQWATTPSQGPYDTAYGNRGECFLGSPCGQSVFAK